MTDTVTVIDQGGAAEVAVVDDIVQVVTAVDHIVDVVTVGLDTTQFLTWDFIRQTRAEVGLTGPEVGAFGDADHDDSDAIRKAVDWVEPGGKIVAVGGKTYLGVPDPATGLVVPLDGTKGFTVEGSGGPFSATFQTADGVGDHIGWFGAPNLLTRTDSLKFRGLTFDSNYANNTIANEDHLNVLFGATIWDASVTYQTGAYVLLPGSSITYHAVAPSTGVTPGTDGGTKWVVGSPPNAFRQRRNPFVTVLGDGLSFADCRFINSPRQSLFFGGKNPGDVTNARVTGCDFVTTVDATHNSAHDWDTTAVFIRGDDCTVESCKFQGYGTAFFISRLAVQITGSRSLIHGNKADKYYRFAVVGNSGISGLAEDVTVTDNDVTNCNGGIEVQSDSWSGWTSGPGVRCVTIADNIIRTNMPTYARANGEASSPYGIKLSNDSDLPYEIVSVDNNEIYHELAYTGGGSRGIGFAIGLDPDDPNTAVSGTSRGLSITNNKVWNAGINGIAVKNSPNGIEVVRITGNTVVNCGNRAGITTQQAAGVRVEGAVTGLTVTDNGVFDFRATRLTTYQLYLNCTSLAGARYMPGNSYAADGTAIPALFNNNLSPLTLVQDTQFLLVAANQLLAQSNHTLQDVTGLSFPIGPNETWVGDLWLIYDSSTAADIKVGLSVPPGCSGSWGGSGPQLGAAAQGNTAMNPSYRDIANGQTYGGAGVGSPVIARVRFVLHNANVAGTVKVQACQQADDASQSTIYADSCLEAKRVA